MQGVSPRRDGRYGVWHQAHGIPEKNIDLRVYVPSFKDRSEGVFRLRATDVFRLFASNRLVLSHVREIILALVGKWKLRADDLTALNMDGKLCIIVWEQYSVDMSLAG
jgi:hypothetical protein